MNVIKQKRFSGRRLNELVDAYFADGDNVKSLAGLALYLGIDTGALAAIYAQPRYCGVLSKARTHIEKDIVENGLKGKYNATMSSFLLKTVFGYSEKNEQTLSSVKVEVSEELKAYAS